MLEDGGCQVSGLCNRHYALWRRNRNRSGFSGIGILACRACGEPLVSHAISAPCPVWAESGRRAGPADRRTASSGGIPAALTAVVFRPWPRATDAAPAVPTDQLLRWPGRAPTDLQPRWVWANGEPSGLSAASIPPLDPDGVDFVGLDLDRSRVVHRQAIGNRDGPYLVAGDPNSQGDADFLGNDPRTLEAYYRKPVTPVQSIGVDLTVAVGGHEKGT